MRLKSTQRNLYSEIKLWYSLQRCRYLALLALERIERVEQKHMRIIPKDIPVKMYNYKSQCRDKKRYVDKGKAKSAAGNFKQNTGNKYVAYLCGYCNYWHIGKEVLE
jgi:hypothetical protein